MCNTAKRKVFLKELINKKKDGKGGPGKGKITFPALQMAEEHLKNTPRYQRSRNGYLRQNFGDESSTFGDLLKNVNFRKQLRSLQEKYKLSSFA